MGYEMRYLIMSLGLSAGVLAAIPEGRAQQVAIPLPREAGRCLKDSFGNLTCTDGTRVIKDSFGNYTIIPPRATQQRQRAVK